MNSFCRGLRTTAFLLLAALPVQASNPSMGLVTHPVYLGEHADADSIALSAVPVWHNYGYGIHSVISQPRVFPGGPLESARGLEFDMNLASVYDIRVSPDDATQVPLMPVALKVGNRPLPANARHTREQALEATLWSLLLVSPGSTERPVVVKIESQDPVHQKYAGSYVMHPEDLTLVEGEIPGSRLARDDRGVVSVVFPPSGNPLDLPSEGPSRRLAFVPLLLGGGAEDNEKVALVPHWSADPGDPARLGLPWTAIPRAMNVFSSKRGENANPVHGSLFDSQNLGRQPGRLSFHGSNGASGELETDSQRSFAAICHAAILTLDSNHDEPLEISFSGHPTEAWETLAGDGWERNEGPHGSVTWRRTFTAAGDLILSHRLLPRKEGGWWLDYVEPELPEISDTNPAMPVPPPGRP